MEKLTMQEEEAMRWIWRIGPCFVKDVLAKYEDPKPPYTTLASVIKNLERKKYTVSKRRHLLFILIWIVFFFIDKFQSF